MERDVSPEEKLLRLIRLKPKKEGKASGRDRQKTSKMDTPQPKDQAESTKRYLTPFPNAMLQLRNVIIVNKILFFLFLGMLAYFFIDYFLLAPTEVTVSPAAQGPLLEESASAEPVRHPYSYYESQITGKDLFAPLLKGMPETESGEVLEMEDIIEDLSLLGVVSGASPQAIIQDNKKQKTYFMNIGDTLGEVELKEILEGEGRVILLYKGREFDLAM